jgi:octaprenyl-diphosphate synthase
MNLKEISSPIQNHLLEFNKYFKDKMDTKVSLLNIIIKYLTQKKGKQVRPVLVFLSAEMVSGVNDRSYVAASLVELLHTATLIHDDVVDQAQERRGLASINAEWNNKIAVLVGDFLLSKGLIAAIEADEFKFLKVTSHAVKRMSEGELQSVDKSRKLEITEEEYFQIISGKTASLMSACTEIGAISVSDDPKDHELLAEYGENLGMAFQIKDDLFDYITKSSLIGKPVGIDLKEKKITLPLIHSFTKVSNDEQKQIKKLIKKGNKLSKKEIKYIIDFAKVNGGIDSSMEKAFEFSNKAIQSIKKFPDSEAKESLTKFAKFVVERNS